MMGDRVAAAFVLAVTASTGVACGDDGEESKTVVVENSGPVCLTSENGMLKATVYVDACVTSGCRMELGTVCQASVTPGRITITSQATILESTEQGRPCPTGCSPAMTACSAALPADGSYSVVHGSEQADVTIPLTGSVSLFSEYACD